MKTSQSPVCGAGRNRDALIVRIPCRAAQVEGVLLRRPVIGAQEMLPLGDFDALLKEVIVIPECDAAVQSVRQREDIEDGLPVFVDESGRNNVAREATAF